MYIITSRENKAYKRIKALKDKKQREKEGVFLIEGERGVCDAIKNGLIPREIAVSEDYEIREGVKTDMVFAKRLFGELAETKTPQGVIGIFPMPEASLADISGKEGSFVVLCENVRDPGNLGTIIRTAHCAGAEGIVLTKGCCDLFNPKTVRSTVASIAGVPVIRGAEVSDAVERLKKMGYKAVAGALTNSSKALYEADLSGKVAFIVGNEGSGITPQTLSAADLAVKIPMAQGAESLNVGVAAAVMMYEKVRVNAKK